MSGRYKMKFSKDEGPPYRLTFAGFLAVRLMEFDYTRKHYSYHGRKLENAVERLMRFHQGKIPLPKEIPSTAELVIWGQAAHDWKEMEVRA